MSSYRGLLKQQKENLLFVDPSIDCTGYSAWELSDTTVRLLAFGAINALKSDQRLTDRVSYMVDCVRIQRDAHACKWVCVEQPPQTIYGYQQMAPERIVARAQSVFKTVAVAMSILSSLRENKRPDPVAFFPRHWELSPKARGNRPVKEWSMDQANILIRDYSVDRESRIYLTTKKDENIADAICMGWFMSHKFMEAASPTAWSKQHLTE